MLSDGRWVTGYRKTLRENPRRHTYAGERTEYRIIFMLPPSLAWSVAKGEHGSAITVGDHGQTTVRSFDSGLVLSLAAQFLAVLAKDEPLRVDAVRQASDGGRVDIGLAVMPGGVMITVGRGRPKLHAIRKSHGGR